MEPEKNNIGHNKANDIQSKSPALERDFYYLSFISKKTEKLVTAVYLMTDFLNSSEPLKWELRTKSVRLMSFVNTVVNQNSSSDGEPLARAAGHISDIVSLLELAASLRFISDMN